TKDKLEQYRGILKLYARERKIKIQDAAKFKKNISWQLSSYKQDIKDYRQIVGEITRGTPKGHIRSLLQSRKNLRLKCHGHETEHIYISIYEENHRKRSQLDKLRYEKKRKMKQCFELQDAIHHETFLNALKQDCKDQCKVIFRTTIIGQLATEDTNDIESKYKRITRNVWNNMKKREDMLTFVREQVEDLWSFAQSLIRTEVKIFDKIKDSLLVHSYRELLSRLEEQMKQRTRLVEQFNRNVKERDSLLSKKNEALSILSNFEHSLVASIEEYNADKNILIEQIAMQKKREFERRNSKKERGELLMDIRASLQNMVAMLVCVKRSNRVTTKRPTDEFEKQIDIPMIEKMETEGLALLSTVSRKVGALFGMSNFEFNKDREERAKDLYQTYISDYRSRLKFKDTEMEPTGLIVEHQAIDSSVPTRAEIKLRSKQAVEAYLRLE
ncbi:hypothetical protein WN48_08651, partial [Eufriesea mexicana]